MTLPLLSWHKLLGRSFVTALQAIIIVMILVPFGMAALYGIRDERSFIVEARTFGAELRLGNAGRGEGGDAWRLEDAIICTRKAKGSLGAASDDDALCPANLYDVQHPQLIEIIWPPGTRIVLSYDPADYLAIALPDLDKEVIGTGGVTIAPGSVILMPMEAWRRSGALPFEATLSIGTDIGPGATHFLMEGRYEARQLLLLAGLFGSSRPVTVDEGRLIRGDLVRVVSTDVDAEAPRSFGFVTAPPEVDEVSGFDIVAYSGLAEAELEIRRHGAHPIRVEPRWHDAALSDPRLLAMATLAALVLTLFEIIKVSKEFYRR